jgi:hypothetical protein
MVQAARLLLVSSESKEGTYDGAQQLWNRTESRNFDLS